MVSRCKVDSCVAVVVYIRKGEVESFSLREKVARSASPIGRSIKRRRRMRALTRPSGTLSRKGEGTRFKMTSSIFHHGLCAIVIWTGLIIDRPYNAERNA